MTKSNMVHRGAANRRVRRFFRGQSGASSTIEFCILFPLIMFFLISSLEVMWLAVRVSFLERGVDTAMREIRLNTADPPDYDGVKTLICDTATVLDSCTTTLRLEMILVDPRGWDGTLTDPTCSDQSEEVDPPTALTVGDENELMIIRVCARMTGLVPNFGLASFFELGADNRFPVMSTNAFVQEPRS
jgi:hypothetical protein